MSIFDYLNITTSLAQQLVPTVVAIAAALSVSFDENRKFTPSIISFIVGAFVITCNFILITFFSANPNDIILIFTAATGIDAYRRHRLYNSQTAYKFLPLLDYSIVFIIFYIHPLLNIQNPFGTFMLSQFLFISSIFYILWSFSLSGNYFKQSFLLITNDNAHSVGIDKGGLPFSLLYVSLISFIFLISLYTAKHHSLIKTIYVLIASTATVTHFVYRNNKSTIVRAFHSSSLGGFLIFITLLLSSLKFGENTWVGDDFIFIFFRALPLFSFLVILLLSAEEHVSPSKNTAVEYTMPYTFLRIVLSTAVTHSNNRHSEGSLKKIQNQLLCAIFLFYFAVPYTHNIFSFIGIESAFGIGVQRIQQFLLDASTSSYTTEGGINISNLILGNNGIVLLCILWFMILFTESATTKFNKTGMKDVDNTIYIFSIMYSISLIAPVILLIFTTPLISTALFGNAAGIILGAALFTRAIPFLISLGLTPMLLLVGTIITRERRPQ